MRRMVRRWGGLRWMGRDGGSSSSSITIITHHHHQLLPTLLTLPTLPSYPITIITHHHHQSLPTLLTLPTQPSSITIITIHHHPHYHLVEISCLSLCLLFNWILGVGSPPGARRQGLVSEKDFRLVAHEVDGKTKQREVSSQLERTKK